MKKLRNKIKTKKGITLIALIITIIVILILAGVVINMTLGNDGLITKSIIAKQRYEYATAKETLDVKLLNIHSECLIEGRQYNLKVVSDELKKSSEITIDIIKYYPTAKLHVGLAESDIPNAITGIVVTVNQYPEYEFLLGQISEGKIGITGVALSENNPIDMSEFTEIEKFERETFGTEITSEKNEEENPIVTPIIGEFTPTVTKVNNTKISVTVPEIDSQNEIIYYLYMVNGKFVDWTNSSTDVHTNNDLASDYTFAVIAIDDKGNTQISKTINQDGDEIENSTYIKD